MTNDPFGHGGRSALDPRFIVAAFQSALPTGVVGLDPTTGGPRYTFGHLFLWDGIDVITIILALFAIPEMISLGVKGGSIAQAGADPQDGVEGPREARELFRFVCHVSLRDPFHRTRQTGRRIRRSSRSGGLLRGRPVPGRAGPD